MPRLPFLRQPIWIDGKYYCIREAVDSNYNRRTIGVDITTSDDPEAEVSLPWVFITTRKIAFAVW